MAISINKNWNYREIVNNLKEIKDEYWKKLAFFSYFDLHEKVVYMRNMRNSIYALNFEEWKKDKIWDYMNGYEFLYVLKRLK